MQLRRSILTLCVVLAGAVVGQAEEKKPDDKEALKALVGNWEATAVASNGTERKPEKKLIMSLTADGKYSVEIGEKKDGAGTYTIDPKAKPPAMEITPTEGDLKDMKLVAIYELKGDELKVCVALPGKDPPKAFKSKEDSGHILVTYKRIKK